MAYAFDEFRSLVSGFGAPFTVRDTEVRYACALVAELAYHHVPQFEIDAKKRALAVPCTAYQAIVQAGVATDVLALLGQMDFANIFVVVDRLVIAVGISLEKLLFIGFRGTSFLFDWKINLTAPLVRMNTAYFHHPFGPIFASGRVHRGFAEEAVRVTTRIVDAIQDNNIKGFERIVLAGHSLGGAVGALSELLVHHQTTSMCIFGAPRYCDTAYYALPHAHPPTQIQRPEDIVPFVPLRCFGYADHPYPFDTSGKQLNEPVKASRWRRTLLFFGKQLEPHTMESYRRELGHTAKAQWAEELLAPYERLKLTKVVAPQPPEEIPPGADAVPPSEPSPAPKEQKPRLSNEDLRDLKVFQDKPFAPELVATPAGEFMMGSPESEEGRFDVEGPQHRVIIGQRFAIGRYPVTFDEYDRFCEAQRREKPDGNGWGRGRRPVVNISWPDAQAYIGWLSQETDQTYRLPSEAQWEYACRAGTTTRYSFGDALTTDNANFGASRLHRTTEVGAYPPNPWGVYDMHGNVFEWVEDGWHENYQRAPTDGSTWDVGGTSFVLQGLDRWRYVVRGGSWHNNSKICRSAYRFGAPSLPEDNLQLRVSCLGFRVARTLP